MKALHVVDAPYAARGATHYETWLVDGDPASNNMGWQWSAGCGCDAQPYFRVFNPVTQGKRFDPEGNYVRRWVPELAAPTARERFLRVAKEHFAKSPR